jgi:hypothetical protein
MDSEYKEVRFDKYCETCRYKDIPEEEDPCNGCLEHGMNLYSEKPVNYEKTKEKKKTEKVDT